MSQQPPDLKQAIYLMADEIRAMAMMKGFFGTDPYDSERKDSMIELASRLAELVDEADSEHIKTQFDEMSWTSISPAMGVDAFLLDDEGRVLLIQRADNGQWAMPGGINEVGCTLAETAVHELWEEAGIKGGAVRLLGMFDGAKWGSRFKSYLTYAIFLMQTDDFTPHVGNEALGARYIHPDDLHQYDLYLEHGQLIAKCLEMLKTGETYFDPASADTVTLKHHQRPEGDT